MSDREMIAMLVEYMAKGFLENIIALFKQEPDLMRHIAVLIADEQVVVRLGATALVEELVKSHRSELRAAVPGLVALLAHASPTIRGDAVNLLGIIGDPLSRAAIGGLMRDENAAVRMLAGEALREIDQGE